MNDKKYINKDFIGLVVEKQDGFLEYQEIPIHHNDVLLAELQAMVNNRNRTLIDVQTKFTDAYPESVYHGQTFNYIYPSNYNSAYVNRASYPMIMSYQEYKDCISNKEEELRSGLLNNPKTQQRLKRIKAKDLSKYRDEKRAIEKDIRKNLEKFSKKLKEDFSCHKFIYGLDYTEKLNEIKQNKAVKMYSTDQLGWTKFSYPIDKDLVVKVDTNFGYGSAAYFFCNLQYKGIDILPYSKVIRYYCVLWTDFIRYTRNYSTDRTSWKQAFDFVIETANCAKENEEQFVNEWIVNEIEEMMTGLEAIFSSTDESLRKYLGIDKQLHVIHPIGDVEDGLYQLVRNCTSSDITEYYAMPNEKIIAFKTEKITGCLALLENLKKLQSITTIADKCIKKIEDLNLRLYPEILDSINSISMSIKRTEAELLELNKQMASVQKTLEFRIAGIKALYKQKKSLVINGSFYSENDARKEYDNAHPEFRPYMEKHKKLNEKIQEKNSIVYLRNSFMKILMEGSEKIKQYLNVA